MIEWKNDAVCYFDGEQWRSGVIANRVRAVKFDDFQLNEIRIGDYIEKSELDTEQKYNDVVDVFGLFGYLESCTLCFKDVIEIGGMLIDDSITIYAEAPTYPSVKRKLTYNQLMAIGKLKRMMNEKSAVKSAPKTTTEVSADKLKTSVDYLNECIEAQAEGGKQYDSSGTGERSFDAAAKAFNALTGEKLSGSDVCLLLACLKVVRQNSDKSRLHDDSLLDGVSYLSLWAEELNKEFK
jgi:hypothetical protein